MDTTLTLRADDIRLRIRRAVTSPPLWATLSVAAVLLALRRPDLITTPQFWAEDGPVFYEQAVRYGVVSVTMPYASYLHGVPRLAALLSLGVDPVYAPAVFVGCAFLCTLYTAALTQSPRCPLPRTAALAWAVVLVPDAFEVLLNLANLQWILCGALLLTLIARDPERWPQRLHDSIAVVALGLTGPFSILLAPLFAWRAVARRTAISTVLAVLAAFAGAVQLWTVWHHPPGGAAESILWAALPAVPGMRVTASLLLGYRVPMEFPRAVEILLGVIALIAIGLLALRRGAARTERIWLAAGFLLLLASALFRCRAVLMHLGHAGYGARYFFPLQLITLWLLIAAAVEGGRRVARIAAAIAVWSVAINAPRLREPRLADLHWASYAGQIKAGGPVSIPINPVPWTLNLPARDRR